MTFLGFNDNGSATEFSICESVAIIEPRDANENAEPQPLFLICALRNGFVTVLKVSPAASSGKKCVPNIFRSLVQKPLILIAYLQ